MSDTVRGRLGERLARGGLFLLLFLGPALRAQTPVIDLFSPASAKTVAAAAITTNAGRVRQALVTPASLEALRQGVSTQREAGPPRVRFELFPNAQTVMEMAITGAGSEPGSIVLRGRDDADPAASAVLVVSGDRLIGNIATADGFFQVRRVEDDLYEIREAPDLGPLSQDDAVPASAPIAPSPAAKLVAGPAPKLAVSPMIDVLVVYTPDARRVMGGSQFIQDFINLAVAEANVSFSNSLVNAQFRLARAVEVNLQLGKPEEVTSDYLDRIRVEGQSGGTTLNALRAYYGADLVSVWIGGPPCTPQTVPACSIGIGYINQGSNPLNSGYAYSLLDARAAGGPDYVFTHEAGHNLGCAHDRNNTAFGGWFSYSYGYQQNLVNPKFATLMAYFSNGCSQCSKVNLWSNPQVVYPSPGGQPTGRPSSGTNSADNALTINNTSSEVSAFRQATSPPANQPPTANSQNLKTNRGAPLPITLTGSDPELQPLLFDVITGPAHGTLQGSAPNLVYQPTSGYIGADQFTFEVSDSRGGFAQATIQLTVEWKPTGAVGVYRAGAWSLDSNLTGAFEPGLDFQSAFGFNGAVPVHGDWNGDGQDEIGIFSNGFWYLDYDGNGLWDNGVNDKQFQFGWNGVTPLVGDWNADGKDTIGIFINGFWYLDVNGNGLWNGPAVDRQAQFGWTGVTPLVGDWDGDGRDKIGIFINGFWYLDYNGSAAWEGPALDRQAEFGWSGVTPLIGDWNGDGRQTIGIYSNGFWFLDATGDGVWGGPGVDIQAEFGFAGATPVLGDWNASGSEKIGIFVNGSWYLDYDGSASWDGGANDKAYSFGQSGDTPVVGLW